MRSKDSLREQCSETDTLIAEECKQDSNPRTPLPKAQLCILLIARLSAPLSYSIISPFIYFMVRDFNITDNESELGYYVGSIASCFAIAQTCTSMFWGATSDRIGRKPCIIIGLFGSSLSLFLFGLSKSLIWAILSRCLCGLLNGNIGVIKTMVGELTDKTNRARAFSYLPMMMGLGNALGPVIGGFLVSPAKKLPYFFDTPFWNTYPYFLPCLFAGSINIFTGILSFCCLEETLVKQSCTISDSESSITSCTSSSNTIANIKSSQTKEISKDKTLESKRPGYKPSSDSESLVGSSESAVNSLSAKKKSSQKISKNSISVMFGLGIMALSAVMYGELFVLWAASDIKVGGLSFEETDVATVMSSNGIAILVFQLLFYPTLQRRLGSLKLYRYVFPLYIAICIAIPMVNIIVRNNGYSLSMYICLYTLTLLRAACNTIGFTSINILLVETAEDTSNLGKLNGLSQTVGAICRSIAPTLCGTVFSYSLTHHLPYPFDYHFVWYILASLCFLNYLNSFRIKLIE
ncbi:MFS general substrate transporter [Conidiobolus coronatus NRRL 28638]|uniref:MFS general substrate transporter n=1 Tax=Conidiobolus coronatus (strain ATCC 28846 / CBS 209.66 / NRRL 28638) TaxID=796925 RepID=A0A137P414_CONC2|nr:MFS general substrate transporter [Conidiobolus coronatus NRRL 28638]|eukprot:KXN69644.1 MFS general substrate transporter [Conidiobolus coronatus NRRL 28638]